MKGTTRPPIPRSSHPIMDETKPPLGIRAYLFSNKLLRKGYALLDAVLTGFWLGLFKRETLHAIDALYYDTEKAYRSETYNRQGLCAWERDCLDRYFSETGCLLVGAAGGGREVLALRHLGYEADGFECNPRLAERANALLREDGFAPSVQVAPRDGCPEGKRVYDGLIIGWGAYMLIQGRTRRITFLKQLRARVRTGAPLLLSFFFRSGHERRFKIAVAVGNTLRRIARRERLAVGDDLAPNYVHYFTEEELASELREGGFEPAYFSTSGYGHAVGRAVELEAGAIPPPRRNDRNRRGAGRRPHLPAS